MPIADPDVFAEFLATIALAVLACIFVFVLYTRALNRTLVTPAWLAGWQSFFSKWGDRAFALAVIIYVLVFGGMALLAYFSFHTGYLQVETAWDLGQYHQIIWNSLHGRLFENTYIRDSQTFLGKTFTPILIAFVPLYALWADAAVLLIVQVVALALGALPIYWYARQQIGRPLAFAIGMAFLLSPGLEHIGLSEFHEIALAVPLLAYASLFLLRRKDNAFFVCLGLALLVKEEIAFVTVMLGIYIMVVQRRFRIGAAVAGFGLVWGFLLLSYVIPFFRGSEYGSSFYYFGKGEIGGGGTRYGYLGNNLSLILFNLATHPNILVEQLITPIKLEYTLHLLVPLLFLPLAGLEVAALALPTFAYSILSSYPLQYTIRSYYFSPLLPFLFFAAVVGIRRILQSSGSFTFLTGIDPRHRRIVAEVCLLAMLLTTGIANYLLHSPGPLGGYFQPERYRVDSHALLGNQLLRGIPASASVAGQNEFLAVLSGRRQIYEVPIPDYRQIDYLIADRTKNWYAVHKDFWEGDLATGYFEILTEQDGYLVARRRSSAQLLGIRFGDEMELIGYSPVPDQPAKGGERLAPVLEWRALRPMDQRYSVQLELKDAQGHVWARQAREPLDGALPTTKWEVGKTIGDQFSLELAPTMPAGNYELYVAVLNPEDGQTMPAVRTNGDRPEPQPLVANVAVLKDHSSVQASKVQIEQPLYVDMGEIRFMGSAAFRNRVRPEDRLSIGAYWRARGAPQGDYAVAIQLRDANGLVAFEQVSRPVNGAYPTTEWVEGEVLLDWHDLTVPANLPVGGYQLYVVLREVSTQRILGETGIGPISVDH